VGNKQPDLFPKGLRGPQNTVGWKAQVQAVNGLEQTVRLNVDAGNVEIESLNWDDTGSWKMS
jgi:hypothetical protein